MDKVIEKRLIPKYSYLYVLKLEDGCYYIGQSAKSNFEGRIKKHFKGKGSAWTRLHRPIEIIEKHVFYGNYREGEILENEKFIEYVNNYGLSKVRGGFFSNTDIIQTKRNLISHGYNLSNFPD